MQEYIINGKFLTQKISGVQRYAHEMIKELDNLVEPGHFFLAIPGNVESVPSYKNIEVIQIGKLKGVAWEQLSFPLYAMKQKAITLNLCNVAPLMRPGIVCIHDAKIKAKPEFFSRAFLYWYRLLFWNAMRHAKMIVTDSIFSKNELLKYYTVSPSKIYIIPAAWQHFERIRYDVETLIRYDLKKDQYCFSISSMEPNKNFRWIAEVARNNPQDIFVVAGKTDKRVYADGLAFEIPSNMKYLGYIRDEEAKSLMRDCKAFLFPTIYEGFGMPPLEAMSAGAKNIIVSDTEVMHELFGDSVIYINPNKYDYNLSDLVDDNQANTSTVLEKYSWKSSAGKLLSILDEND